MIRHPELVLLCAALPANAASAQITPPAATQAPSATVTFYSHGSRLTTGIPGVKHDVYFGSIYDGSQALFGFRDTFWIHNDRFLTFRLSPGPHTFGASYGKKPLPRESLAVTLLPGEHYFIRAQGEASGLIAPFVIEHGRLDLVACEDAVIDMKTARPLSDKALSDATLAHKQELVVPETAPPPCPDLPITPPANTPPPQPPTP